MAKNVYLAYFFWLFGGWFGLHHFYLGRDRQAFIWWVLVAGYGGIGWCVDFFRIPKYVREANGEYEQSKSAKEPRHPPFSLYRFCGQVAFGNVLSWLTARAIPEEEIIPGISLSFLYILVPLGTAIGVHAVGCIGRQHGSLKHAMVGAYLAYIPCLLLSSQNPYYYLSSVLAALTFRYGVKWRMKRSPRRNICKRLATLSACGFIYLSLWGSFMYFNLTITNDLGETIKFRDSVKNLLKSPMWTELKDSLQMLWQYYKVHGWSSLWKEILEKMDPMGETNALRVLELPKTATQEEITQKYRKLVRQWHPDKFIKEEEKVTAQAKFVEIKEAYEKLSTLYSRRTTNRMKSDYSRDDKDEL